MPTPATQYTFSLPVKESRRQMRFPHRTSPSPRRLPPRVLELLALLRMKLTAFRLKDQVHIMDMIEVGLIDAGWVNRLPPELGARLQELLDNPEG